MVAVNEEQLIGGLIPDVYIKRITLETTGTPIRETNPHIEHARESVLVQKDPSDNFLIINLDLVLKEELSGLSGTWFSNQNFAKYLKLMVIQSTDSLVTKLYSASNNAIQVATMNSETEQAIYVAELMQEVKHYPEFLALSGRAAWSDQDLPELLQLIENNTEVKHLPLFANPIVNNPELLEETLQRSGTTSVAGAQIFDFTFRVRFEVPTKTPHHLSYFAVTSIDIDQLLDDFNLDASDTAVFSLMSGKVVADTVINNKELISKSFIFQGEGGKIWTGPVHEGKTEEGLTMGWLTGTKNSEVKNPVTKYEVENNKIQDFRDFDTMEKLQLDFSVVQNTVNLSFKRMTNDNMDPPRLENYFSDAALSRSPDGVAHLAFAMDYGKLIRDYTQYGALYSHANRSFLFNHVRIRHFRLIRRRVKKGYVTLNQLGSPTDRRVPFDKNEPNEIISYTGEMHTSSNKLKDSYTSTGNIRELKIHLNNPYDGVRHFTGRDRTIINVTDGFYQYGIEMEVEDNTTGFIAGKLGLLNNARKTLDEYYNMAVLPNHFDPVSNRFTQEFIDKMYSEHVFNEEDAKSLKGLSGELSPYSPQLFYANPWIKPLITYLDILSFFRKVPIKEDFAVAMWKYLDPKSGNPRSISMIQKLIENLMSRVAAVTGADMPSKRSGMGSSAGSFANPSYAMAPGKPQTRTFKIEYYFPQMFSCNMPKELGYDFLSPGRFKSGGGDGLKSIQGTDFLRRVKLETLKYFSKTDPDIDMLAESVHYTKDDNIENTQLSYLTPSNVSLGVHLPNISLLDESFNLYMALKMQSIIANINISKKSSQVAYAPPNVASVDANLQGATQLSATTIQIKHQLTNIMSDKGCVLVTPGSSPFHNMSQYLLGDHNPYADVKDTMGEEWQGIDGISYTEEENDQGLNTNPVPLFANLAQPMIMYGAGMAGIFSNYKVIEANVSQESGVNSQFKYNMDFYELGGDSRSAVHVYNSSANYVGGSSGPDALSDATNEGAILDESSMNPKLMSALVSLPNQVKSLFLQKTPGASVRYNWAGSNAPLMQTPGGKAVQIFNYKMIRKVEILVGYETDANGFPLLKRPLWSRLTYDLFRAAGLGKILCRTVRYENKTFGVEEALGMRLPIYDKYFFINRPGRAEQQLYHSPKSYLDKLQERLQRITEQHANLSSEYLSTLAVGSSTVKPVMGEG